MKETLRRELDFEQEGRNAEQCRRDLRHLKYIYIPEVNWKLTSKVRSMRPSAMSVGLKGYVHYTSVYSISQSMMRYFTMSIQQNLCVHYTSNFINQSRRDMWCAIQVCAISHFGKVKFKVKN
jgi:hypothetical protein